MPCTDEELQKIRWYNELIAKATQLNFQDDVAHWNAEKKSFIAEIIGATPGPH